MYNFNKLFFSVLLMASLSLTLFAQEADEILPVSGTDEMALTAPDLEEENSDVEFYFEVENASEFEVGGGLENETSAVVGLQKEVADGLVVGGLIKTYIDLLEDKSCAFDEGDTEHFNSAYLSEATLGAAFNLSYSPLDWLTLNGGVGVEFNARPDDYLYGYRVGFGLDLGLVFEVGDHFLSAEIANSFTPVWGVGADEAKNSLLINSFAATLRYDLFNYIKEDINLGLFTELAVDTENLTKSGEKGL